MYNCKNPTIASVTPTENKEIAANINSLLLHDYASAHIICSALESETDQLRLLYCNKTYMLPQKITQLYHAISVMHGRDSNMVAYLIPTIQHC